MVKRRKYLIGLVALALVVTGNAWAGHAPDEYEDYYAFAHVGLADGTSMKIWGVDGQLHGGYMYDARGQEVCRTWVSGVYKGDLESGHVSGPMFDGTCPPLYVDLSWSRTNDPSRTLSPQARGCDNPIWIDRCHWFLLVTADYDYRAKAAVTGTVGDAPVTTTLDAYLGQRGRKTVYV